MCKERGRIMQGLEDIFHLKGKVSEGVFSRIETKGAVPDRGLGYYSIPNTISRERVLGALTGSTKSERRSWNRSNQLGKNRR